MEFIKSNRQTIGLLAAMVIGIVFPQIHSVSFLIRALIMAMLFLAFINLKIERRALHRSHLYLLVLAPFIASVSFLLIRPFDAELALVAFLIAMTPTATASPVVTSLIGGNASYTALMVLASSILQPFLLSLALPFFSSGGRTISLSQTLIPVVLTIAVPFLAARFFMRCTPSFSLRLNRLKPLSFFLWLLVLILASAEASFFLRSTAASHRKVLFVAGISLFLCCLNFTLGRFAGGKLHPIEASQSLGQKNTLFTIWVALAFVSPFAAMGPAFYILWHNLWNVWQIHLFNVRKKKTD
jgi:BASS family bile acid:Na+ symporter